MLRLRPWFGWLAIFMLMCGRVHGAMYAVGPDKPYKTLQNVTALLEPGDVVTVDGGVTYPGGVTLPAKAGTGVIRVVGKRVDGKRPVLAGGGVVLRVAGSHYVIEGFDITAAGDPLTTRCFYNVGDDVTLRDCLVHDCHCTGIAGSDSSGSLTLDGVEVCRCGQGLYAHQIYVGSSLAKYPDALFRMQYCYIHDGAGGNNVKSRVTRNEIEYNWIEGAMYHELDLVGPDPKAQPTPPGGIHCDGDIIGNVLVKDAASQGAVARMGTDGNASSRGRYRFVNNTVIVRAPAAATSGLFWIKGEVESVGMWNNVFWSDVGPMNMMRQEGVPAPLVTEDMDWLPVGTMRLPPGRVIRGKDPGFVNEAKEDFRPRAKSPLISSGVMPPDGVAVTGVPPMPKGAAGESVRAAGREKDIGAYPKGD